jgi:hypothetical protein
MGGNCYVFCKLHRETLEAGKWQMVSAPQEFLGEGAILDKRAYARRARAMEINFRGDSFESERHWIEREFAILDAFLDRHTICDLRVASAHGPEAWIDDYDAHYRTGDRVFSFEDDREWSLRKPGDMARPYHRDVVKEIRGAPPL